MTRPEQAGDPANRGASISPWILVLRGQVALAAVVAVGWVGLALGSRIDADYAAGEMADNLAAWLAGAKLYAPLVSPPYRILNYPPVFFAGARAIATALRVPPLYAGRMLSVLLATVAVGCALRWARTVSRAPRMVTIALGLLGTSYCALYFVPQFHLQWPAVALDVLALYLAAVGRGGRSAAVAGLLAALACFVKQTQVVPGAIAFFWLVAYQRRRAAAFAASGLGAGMLGVALCQALFGGEIWRQLFTYTVGSFSPVQLLNVWWEDLVPWLPPLLLGLWIGVKEPALRRDLRWWYFAGSSLWLVSCARVGASSQYLIEWTVATLVWATPWLAERFGAAVRGAAPRWSLFALATCLVAVDARTVQRLVDAALRTTETDAVLPGLCAVVPSGRLLLVERAAVARACGREPVLHPFILSALARQGLWDETPFVRALGKGEFPVALMPFDPAHAEGAHAERWTPRMLEAIQRQYREVTRRGAWRILVPRR